MPRNAVIFMVVAVVLVVGAGLLQDWQAMLYVLVGVALLGAVLLVLARAGSKRR